MKRKVLISCAAVLAALLICGWLWGQRVEKVEEGRTHNNHNESPIVVRFPPQSANQVNDQFDWHSKVKSLPSEKIPTNWRERAALYEPLIQRAALASGVDPRLLWIIAFLETRFQPNLISPKGARGIMQFMPATAARYGLNNPDDAAESIAAAARYVHDLSVRFGHRFDLILASYNAGEGTVDAYLKGYALRLSDGRVINRRGLKLEGLPPYAETRNYVARGLTLARLLGISNFKTTNLNANRIALTISRQNVFHRQEMPSAMSKVLLTTSIYAASPGTAPVAARPISEETRDARHRSLRASSVTTTRQ